VAIANHDDAQPLRFALRVGDAVNGCVLTLPDGLRISFNQKLEKGQFILCRGNEACVADANRKPTAKLALSRAAVLPQGESKLGVGFLGTAPAHFTLTAWVLGAGEALPSRRR